MLTGSSMIYKKDYLASNTRTALLTVCGIIFMSAILNPKDRVELLVGMAFMGLTILAMMDNIKRKNKAKQKEAKKPEQKE